MEKLHKEYKDKAAIFVVYIREAHPSDGWASKGNKRQGIDINQPTTLPGRAEVAKTCLDRLSLSIPCLLDDMQATAQKAYSGWPDRHYVIGVGGKITVKGAPGPRGFSVAEARAGLVKILGQ